MPNPGTFDDHAAAEDIIKNGLGRLKELVRTDPPEEGSADDRVGPWMLGSVVAWTAGEYRHVNAFKQLMRDYLRLPAPPRPLCLAVFGQPGSGKSFVVRTLAKDLSKESKGELHLPLVELNLTQFRSTRQLGSALAERTAAAAGSDPAARTTVPLVFFDEFDAPLRGVPMGWLPWFLAPMQDGVFGDGIPTTTLTRAIYVFAGGTAHRMSDLGVGLGEHFRLLKGPDFVSRLRGWIDVEGPNALTARQARRAVLTRVGLEKVEESRTGRRSGVARELSPGLRDGLLKAGRFRHGARSIHAVLEMAAARSVRGGTVGVLDLEHLPEPHLRAAHVDLGPLDGARLGGPIAMSGGGAPEEPVASRRDALWKELARSVWQAGGTVSYGGNRDGGGLTEVLQSATNGLPVPLDQESAPVTRVHWYDASGSSAPPPDSPLASDFIRRLPVASSDARLKAGTDDVEPLNRAIQLFRLRWRQSQACVARVALSGKTGQSPKQLYQGRMPGVLEEVLLSLICGHPVYVIGGLGDCAAAVGQWLGLGGGASVPSLAGPAEKLAGAVRESREFFQPGGRRDLPLTTQDAIDLLAGFAIGGPLWPDNGLSIAENQELFGIRLDEADLDEAQAQSRRHRIVNLVMTGLTRRFGQL